ncbi:membrane fusion protein (multidrug efflux system) [Rhizomicrobium palustre]|uniref:Membrane fusion protein (Multidrug efflux system) n=1 Tax=Rhizomicrobium palustre TaxID=189966 RepID=A0A846MVI2_9PROT|nr:HlyD family secretion protein [Rhizomicrobium palustre]NIK87102.1 membrane fusion protein (multidrug efflux system) [Rhizomicrobium palustre]
MQNSIEDETVAAPARRKKLFLLLGTAVAAVALGAGGYWYFVASHYVSTDNAYVQVSSAQVTPLTTGRVMDVRVHDAEAVKKGDILVVIDPEDAKLQLDQAQAAYALTLRKVKTYFATADARRADYERAKLDYDRRAKIQKSGAVSGEELSTMKTGLETATAALESAEAMTQGTSVEKHPEVLAAKAALDTAQLNYERTIIRAPVSGIVAQRNVQIGQMIQAGRPVMTVVPVADVYVDANYKEDQLAKVRPGQNAELESDIYGSSVKFRGTVIGLGGGTGAAFSLIPAQNATGNWIKVVQRVPVRIALDPEDLKAHPLRVGLSMQATIDVSK